MDHNFVSSGHVYYLHMKVFVDTWVFSEKVYLILRKRLTVFISLLDNTIVLLWLSTTPLLHFTKESIFILFQYCLPSDQQTLP